MAKFHPFEPSASFDGGNLDCGNGLLLLIRKHIDPLEKGEFLEIKSTESSVDEDLPAWCRLTNNELVSIIKEGRQRSFLVCKGKYQPDSKHDRILDSKVSTTHATNFNVASSLPSEIPNFAVMNIGSWPRPTWLLDSLHKKLEGKIADLQFEAIADDAVRLCVFEQEKAGADVITDGEQRRDNYASFVANKLDNCQLIPLVDLLPLVEDPDKFAIQLQKLDVPIDTIRHPAVFGKISRTSSLTLNEAKFLRTITAKPIKIALPGPYLLSRTMWMECISDTAYKSREELALDIVKVLREELVELIDFGVEIVQFDEPVLTEVVFSGHSSGRSFMCGALGEKKPALEELNFASTLLESVIKDLPKERIGLHICRGNWTKDESKALSGSYELLAPYFERISVGTLFLEHATKRAGNFNFLKKLINKFHLGIGLVNQKSELLETETDIINSVCEILSLKDNNSDKKNYLVPDCGFATFADSPLCNSQNAQHKLSVLKAASIGLGTKHI